MTASMLVGCLLLAYGPPAVLLLGYVARRSALLVLTIARCARATRVGCPGTHTLIPSRPASPRPRSAFFWLFAILLTSLVWLAVPPLQVSV